MKNCFARSVKQVQLVLNTVRRISHGALYQNKLKACISPSGIYEIPKIETGHKGQLPNTFDNGAVTSLHLVLVLKNKFKYLLCSKLGTLLALSKVLHVEHANGHLTIARVVDNLSKIATKITGPFDSIARRHSPIATWLSTKRLFCKSSTRTQKIGKSFVEQFFLSLSNLKGFEPGERFLFGANF